MNIFVLDHTFYKAAEYHVDKHIVKMPLETAQILCSARHLNGDCFSIPYKLTHKHHPCVLWAAKSLNNYKWLCNFGLALCSEYEYRYGREHKCKSVILDSQASAHSMCFSCENMTDFVQAMPDQYKSASPVQAYRAYYLGEKSSLASWKNRSKPFWWK